MLKNLFYKPFPSENKAEVEKLLAELIKIGERDDFLSERPGPPLTAIAVTCAPARLASAWMRLAALT